MEKEDIQRKLDASESRWEAIQLTAANAQRELDYAIAVFDNNKEELDKETLEATLAKVDEQKEQIKTYLLKGMASYKSDRAYLLEQLARLEKAN